MDPRDPAVHLRDDFHTELARLRREDPVHEYAPGEFAVTKYHDIRAISRDPATFCSGRGALVNDPLRSTGRAMSGRLTLVHMDPPEHVRVRQLMHRAFTPRAVRELDGAIRARARRIAASIPAGTEIDVVADVAVELPVMVIADLLGVPDDARADFARWSDAAIEAADHSDRDTVRALAELLAFLGEHVEAKHREPADADLVARLVRDLDDEDAVIMCLMLLVAGNETTRHLISGGVTALARHPEQWTLLRDEPARTADAVEELLRWITPVQTFCRTATRDTTVRGQRVREGDYVVLWYPSGNRDEEVFGAGAETLDISRRADATHVAFGFGEHLCLGASLARLEARAMFEALTERFDAVAVTGAPEWVRSTIMHGLQRCPVVFS